MEKFREFLDQLIERNWIVGNLRGFFHVAIGRKITSPGGDVISVGLTWRELASQLRASRLSHQLVEELGADADTLSPGDRGRFWYAAITLAKPDSAESILAGEKFAKTLIQAGYQVGASPVPISPLPPPRTASVRKPQMPPPPPTSTKKKKSD